VPALSVAFVRICFLPIQINKNPRTMASSAKLAIAGLFTFGVAILFLSPTIGRAEETAKPNVEVVKFAADQVTVPFEAPAVGAPQATPPSAAQAEKAPADTAGKGGVIYRRLSYGNFMASHYDGKGKLTRRDIYIQPNELIVLYFDANGKPAYRQTFYVWLDVYLRKGKFGYQHQWMFELRRLEVFHADGRTHSKIVVFYPHGGPARMARDVNVRGGTTAVRTYRADGSRLSEELYRNGILQKITRHTQKENLRETLDPVHSAIPSGTVLIDSEDNSAPGSTDTDD
jgi:hypothetical protein